MDDDATLEMLQERWDNARWTIYVCAEPDGEKCDSGTHPNILAHRCVALQRFYDGGVGPQIAAIPVVAEQDAEVAEFKR
jgi:hypothetical protein